MQKRPPQRPIPLDGVFEDQESSRAAVRASLPFGGQFLKYDSNINILQPFAKHNGGFPDRALLAKDLLGQPTYLPTHLL